jgi:iron complex transport system substrate-binding protein
MVALAGGIDVLGRAGEPGYQVSWQTVVDSDPDLILAMPCGYHVREVERELAEVPFPAEWYALRAVRNGNVSAMDASSYFSRPGPRIAEGILAMADVFRQAKLATKSAAPLRQPPVRLQMGNRP